MMAGFGACQEIRLEISCSGSRSKLHLEPYGAQAVPKQCFAKIGPCQEAMPCRPSWILPDKKPMCSGVGCLRRFFSGKNATPRFWACRQGHIFNDFWSCFNKKMANMFHGPIFRGNFGGDHMHSYSFRTFFVQFSCHFRTIFANIDPYKGEKRLPAVYT